MTLRTGVVSFLFTAAVAALAATALSAQDKNQPGGDQAEMMAKWAAFSTPSDGHKALQAKIGKWSGKVKMFMAPGAPPMESSGTSEAKWIMDGRYVQDTTEGSFMGQPFHGMGVTGYDNLKKKYVATWIDNMGTGFLIGEGNFDAATKTFNYVSESPDVLAGKYVKSRSVEKIIDADHWTMQMFGPDPKGKEYMSMEIEYTRQK